MLFVQPLLQPVLSDSGVLITAGVRFDVFIPVLSPGGGGAGGGGDSVRPGFHLLVSGNAGD